MSDNEQPTPEDSGAEQEETSDVLRTLYADVGRDIERLRQASAASRAQGSVEQAVLLSEISGTVLYLMREFVGIVGEGMSSVEDRLDTLEDESDYDGHPNRLDESQGAIYGSVFEANIKMIGMALMIASGDQVEELEALKRLNQERLEFTHEITVIDDYGEAEDPVAEAELVLPTGHA